MLLIFFTFIAIVLFTTQLRTTASHKSNEEVLWPEGTYGLPRATSGCPRTNQFVWDQGWRLQNMDHGSKNEASKLSKSFHMEVSLFRRLLTRTFCIKLQREKNPVKRRWPKGSYCIYQYGDKCPSGMVNGFIKWDDENQNENVNQALGSLPYGDYTERDTKIFYCCQNQSSWYDVIELPISSSFYLLPYKPRFQAEKECQRVKWAIATMEYIRFDTEDQNNEDTFRDHHVITDEVRSLPTVYYCYYESCQYKIKGSRGHFNSSGSSLVPRYPSYQSCSWLITVDESSVVSLNLSSLYISDCKENFLKIYDGASEVSPRVATHCGFTTPKHIEVLSSGRNIYIVLNSGNLSQNMNYSFGFEARYGPTKVIVIPTRSPHNVVAIGLTFFALILIFVVVSVVIGYRRRSRKGVEKKELTPKPTSRFHVPSTISMEALELSERLPPSKETRNPYYVTARLWDDSSLSRSSDNVAYVTSPELNHGYMDAPEADHDVI